MAGGARRNRARTRHECLRVRVRPAGPSHHHRDAVQSTTILCDHPDAVFATVLDQDGLPIKGVIVAWSLTVFPSSGDRILQATSKTNKDGVARTMVKPACAAGDRTITATAGGISGSAVVHVDVNRPGKGPTGAQGAAAKPFGNNAGLATGGGFFFFFLKKRGGGALMGTATLVLRLALAGR